MFVVLSTAVGFGAFVDIFIPSRLAPELHSYIQNEHNNDLIILINFIGFASLIFGIIAFIGILLFKKWSRTLYVLLAISAFLLLPFYPTVINSGLSTAFSYFYQITIGIIIALMYMKPVKDYFESET